MRLKNVTIDKPEEVQPHDAAMIYPPMRRREFEALKAHIQAHGLKEKIVLFDGEILDGKERLRACLELGTDLSGALFDLPASADPYEFALQKNALRRHLSHAGQKATSAVLYEKKSPTWANECKARQKEANAKRSRALKGNSNAKKNETKSASSYTPIKGPKRTLTTSMVLGEKFGVSSTYVEQARYIYRHDRAAFDEVHRGNKELTPTFGRVQSAVTGTLTARIPASRLKANPPQKKGKRWKPEREIETGPNWIKNQSVSESLAAVFDAYWKHISDNGSERTKPLESLMSLFSDPWIVKCLDDIQAVRKTKRPRPRKRRGRVEASGLPGGFHHAA